MVNDLVKLKSILSQLKIYPNKQRGQSFLYDQEVIKQIVASVLECQTKQVIEIGPGLGAISDQLDAALKSSQYKLVEVDRLLYDYLVTKHYYGQVIHADCLQLDGIKLTNQEDFLFFGNLPYSIGTPILLKWINDPISTQAIFMLQKEVVERLVSGVKKKVTEVLV